MLGVIQAAKIATEIGVGSDALIKVLTPDIPEARYFVAATVLAVGVVSVIVDSVVLGAGVLIYNTMPEIRGPAQIL